jgi:hypothetical protein
VLPWRAIKDVIVADAGQVSGRSACVAFEVESGAIVRALGLASFRRSKVENMRRQIAALRPLGG